MASKAVTALFFAFLLLECSLCEVAHSTKVAHARRGQQAHKLHEVLDTFTRALGNDSSSKHRKVHGKHHTRQNQLEEVDNTPDLIEANFIASLPEGSSERVFFQRLMDMEKAQEKETNKKMIIFIIAVVITIIAMGALAFVVTRTNDSNIGFGDFFLGKMTPLSIIVGMCSGLVFGFIDNAGLFWGMEYLDPILSNAPNGHEPLVLAGYGNTFSDMIGAFLGTFAGKMIEELAKKSDPNLGEYPIWTEAFGITFGCLIGIAVPRLISGDPDKKLFDEMLEKAKALEIPQDQIDELLTQFDVLDKTVDKEVKGRVRTATLQASTRSDLDEVIREADSDGNGWVTKGEVMQSLVRAKIYQMRKSARALIRNTEGQQEPEQGPQA